MSGRRKPSPMTPQDVQALAADIGRKHGVEAVAVLGRSRNLRVAAARAELIVALYQVKEHSQSTVAALLGVTQPAVCVAIDRHLNRQRSAA